jgi:predicted phage terminase large subunit-like protein
VLTREEKEQLYLLKREKRLRQARQSFWEFCKLLHPDFYKQGRDYLEEYCDILQALYENRLLMPDGVTPYRRLIVNMPPRHGKSRTLFLFTAWCFGKDKKNMVLTASYDDQSAIDFSKFTRNEIAREKLQPTDLVFNDVFPETKIKHGDSAMEKWALEGCHFSYKGFSVTNGAVTGKGGNIIIIDDPLKGSYEARHQTSKQKVIDVYTGTILSRSEGDTIEIINMTRWASDDLCGYVLNCEDGNEWYVHQRQACDLETGEMLCEGVLSKKKYISFSKRMDYEIFMANYHNQLIDKEGALYKNLKLYDYHSLTARQLDDMIMAIDIKDRGTDFFAAGAFARIEGQLYIRDIIYTQEDMGVTQPATAAMLHKQRVKYCRLESQGGGDNFKRTVVDILWNEYQNRNVFIETFPQKKNKEAKILDWASWIIMNVFFPMDWNLRWPKFYKAITEFQALGKNTFDDGPDMLTSAAEITAVDSDGFEGG